MTTQSLSQIDVTVGLGRVPELALLVSECEAISTEAFSVADLSQVVTDRFPRLAAAIKDAFRFMLTWDFSKPEVLNYNSVAAVLRKVQYTDMDDILVSKPVGFVGNLHQLVSEHVELQLPVLTQLSQYVLDPVIKAFSTYLDYPAELTNRRVLPIHDDFKRDRIQALLEAEKKWYVEGNRAVEASFTALYQNNRECVETMVRVSHLNDTRWKAANPKDIKKKADVLKDVASALFTTVHEQKLDVSKQVMKALGDDLQTVAHWLEWYSVMTTRFIDVTTALKLTEKKILRCL